MRKITRFALLSIVVSCAHEPAPTGTQAEAAVPPGKYALKLRLAPGEVRRYAVSVDVHTTVSANDATMMDAPLKMSYVDVLEVGASGNDGATELKERLENIQVTAEGPMGEMIKQATDSLGKVVMVSRLTADGKTVSTRSEGADNPMLQGMLKQMAHGTKFNFLPQAPVGPGDSWQSEDDTEVQLGTGSGGKMHTVSKHSFARVEPCGDASCAIIETDVDMKMADGSPVSGGGKGHTTTTVGLKDGRPRSSQGSQESKLQGQQSGQNFDVVSKVQFESRQK
jgi:hypothetical protein